RCEAYCGSDLSLLSSFSVCTNGSIFSKTISLRRYSRPLNQSHMTAISAEPISIEIQPPSSNLIRLATRNVISMTRNSAVSKMTTTMDTRREYKYAAINTVDISIVSVTARPKAASMYFDSLKYNTTPTHPSISNQLTCGI